MEVHQLVYLHPTVHGVSLSPAQSPRAASNRSFLVSPRASCLGSHVASSCSRPLGSGGSLDERGACIDARAMPREARAERSPKLATTRGCGSNEILSQVNSERPMPHDDHARMSADCREACKASYYFIPGRVGGPGPR
jgi:hypothetical protein